MKRFLLVILLLCIVLFGVFQVARQRIKHDLMQPVTDAILSPSPTLEIAQNQKQETYLFVPYWSLSKNNQFENNYEQYIYFGITPGTSGIAQEPGLARIEAFTSAVPEGKTKLLTLRMVNGEINTAILKNTKLQQTIIAQTTKIAKQYGFSGVVLDLEMSALPFDSLIEQINSFTGQLATGVHKENLQFSVLLYGDTLYRARPFDIKKLASKADRVMVMSYDFHKARGNPGPNFPLHGKETYGYDLAKMADDYVRLIPSEKVVIVFGMYGYDWLVDESGNATAAAQAVTDIQIRKQFLDSCRFAGCTVTRDSISAETKVRYKDTEGKNHIVWFEDDTSVAKKQAYLKNVGLVKYAYWAYSYF